MSNEPEIPKDEKYQNLGAYLVEVNDRISFLYKAINAIPQADPNLIAYFSYLTAARNEQRKVFDEFNEEAVKLYGSGFPWVMASGWTRQVLQAPPPAAAAPRIGSRGFTFDSLDTDTSVGKRGVEINFSADLTDEEVGLEAPLMSASALRARLRAREDLTDDLKETKDSRVEAKSEPTRSTPAMKVTASTSTLFSPSAREAVEMNPTTPDVATPHSNKNMKGKS
jgi:hypothetical protein